MSDTSALATKNDIKLLMDSMGRIYDANERWKDEMKHHFDVALENTAHDIISAKSDRVANHEDRILRLERHTRIAV
jgi:hypothetical protein